MSQTDGIEEFRSLFGKGRGHADLYEGIVGLIGSQGRWSPVQREYVMGHVSRWPDEVARRPPRSWWAAAVDQDVPALELCNTCTLEHDTLLEPLASPHLTGLTRCTIENDDTMNALLDVDAAWRLESLDASCGFLDASYGEKLASWEGLSSVRRLNLSFNALGDEGAAGLAASPHLGELEELTMADCRLGPKGMEELMAAPSLKKLKLLDLRHNAIGKRGVMAILNAPFASQLEWIHLYGEDAKKGGLEALAKSEVLSEALRGYYASPRSK